ncbi:hypothetical protein D3C71_1594640 [compost metagenome]
MVLQIVPVRKVNRLEGVVEIAIGHTLGDEDQCFLADGRLQLLQLLKALDRRVWGSRGQFATERPLLQRGKQRIQRGQGAAVGGFEGFDGGDAGGEGLLEGEGGERDWHRLDDSHV